jgi:N-acetyl-anhydromuramyl-L-alanine amidase AmpD
VTFTSENTLAVLLNRGLSYNFLIDGDDKATLYQTHNPTLQACLHAGDINNFSVGICLNNPADVQLEERDAQRRGRRRGKQRVRVHAGTADLLKFFPEQVSVAKTLVKTLCHALKVPYRVPRDAKGQVLPGVIPNYLSYSGILGHFHATTRKIDPAQLDWSIFDT